MISNNLAAFHYALLVDRIVWSPIHSISWYAQAFVVWYSIIFSDLAASLVHRKFYKTTVRLACIIQFWLRICWKKMWMTANDHVEGYRAIYALVLSFCKIACSRYGTFPLQHSNPLPEINSFPTSRHPFWQCRARYLEKNFAEVIGRAFIDLWSITILLARGTGPTVFTYQCTFSFARNITTC